LSIAARDIPLGVNQLGRKKYRFDHARGVRDPPSRDIEGGAVVDRGADYWETEGHIDCISECKAFDSDQRLVVKEGKNGVELAAGRAQKQGISGEGPHNVDPGSSLALDHRGSDLQRFFRSEEPMFAGVWVESGDGYSRTLNTEASQLAIKEQQSIYDSVFLDLIYCFGKAQVSCQGRNAQVTGDEAHERLGRTGEGGEHLGVAGVGRTGVMEGFFVDWRGSDRVEFSVEAKSDGGLDGCDGGAAGIG
jgi:hypothetical protein